MNWKKNTLTLVSFILMMGCGKQPSASYRVPFYSNSSGQPQGISPVQATPTPSPCTGCNAPISPPTNEGQPQGIAPTTYPQRPVIFVPGFMEAVPKVFFYGIKDYLEKQGWMNLSYLNNGLVIEKAEKYAQKVKEKIESVLKETGAQKVDIVAHSYGGIYTRYYIKNLEGADKIEHFISIASPHKGTKLAVVGSFLTSARQMTPNSDFLEALNKDDPTPGNVCYTTVRSNLDEIVIPYDSAFLKGATNHLVRSKDHFTILYSKETYNIIQKTLSHPCDCCRIFG